MDQNNGADDEMMDSKKRKRRAGSNHNNPLSNARKVQVGDKQQQMQNSKANIKAQGLWHRKSGAGFDLFVQYYGGQPIGVVVTGMEDQQEQAGAGAGTSNNNNAGNKNGATNQPTKAALAPAGKSRAAKRRQKKKGKGPLNNMTEETATSTDAATPFQSEATSTSTSKSKFTDLDLELNSKSPLVQALAKHSDCRHLTPLIAALSTPLPLTFRFRTHYDPSDKSDESREHLERVEIVKDKLLSRHMHSQIVAPIPYDPTETTFQAHVISKFQLSKAAPELKALLMESTANGCIARQELGSMLPVIALAGGKFLKRGSRVLDLCASPGSKTLQALEHVVQVTAATVKGRVVANDLHPTRLESLKAAVARSGLPPTYTDRITYANFDASTFPTPKSGRLFDAIMADVPCSGDGTIRKDPHVLPLWTPDTGTALHKLQVRILKRALELCQVGGVVCYSTCTLNPVEDEAVVAAAIQAKSKSKYKLVEFPTSVLPGFIRHKGVCDWKVAGYKTEGSTPANKSDKEDESDNDLDNENENDLDSDNDFGQLKWYENYKDAREDDMANCQESLWPNPEYNHETLHMELCTRLWPQDQDTGGFFVALIQRLS